MGPDGKHETLWQWLQAAPSLGAIFAALMEVPVETWLARWGITFLILQCAYLLWRWWRQARIDRRRAAAQMDLESDKVDL